MTKRLRIIVDSWDADTITGHTEAEHLTVRVWNHDMSSDQSDATTTAPLIPCAYLYPDVHLNLLLFETRPDGMLVPQHIVLAPDFLVDVTSICRCFTHHGDVPAMHLLSKFMPSSATAAILLGNAANQMLDDCVNQPSPTLQASLLKAFAADPIRFATVPGIDSAFSQACQQQFANIQTTISQLQAEGTFPVESASLETAFICEPLGIQGRMDLISDDLQSIIELKSGRGEEYGHPPGQAGYRYEHALQMALYKESLYYNANLPYARVHTYIFYSRYPQLIDIHPGRRDIHRALDVRNGIVHLEHLLCHQPAALLDTLVEGHFNLRGIYDRFYCNYQRPTILSFLNSLHGMSAIERAYFYTYLSFMEREQNLAKTGIEGASLPPGVGGFADVWRTDMQTKLQAGNIIANLHITSIVDDGSVVAIEATHQPDNDAMNFRPGDMVMLHEQASNPTSIDNQRQAAAIYTSCIIDTIRPDSLLLRLRFPQRDTRVFHPERLYVVEPSHADASYQIIYRGLFSLLSAPVRRRQLILGQREPEFDTSITLTLPIEDPEGHAITTLAKQARDYFLLVGPPGTGKTSVALRRMVREFLASTSEIQSSGTDYVQTQPHNLLLMAFTNRAVDEICAMLDTLEAASGYIRIGPELSCAPPYRNHLLTHPGRNCLSRAAVRQAIQQAPVIVGTIASISAIPELFLLKTFHTAIIDEASQVLEPQLMPLLCATTQAGESAIGKFIFIGDHKQLPAVVAQTDTESAVTDPLLTAIGIRNCRDSLFERLHRLATRRGEPHTVALLHRQGRMHPSLSRFVNNHYYSGQLTEVPVPHQQAGLEWQHYLHDTFLQALIATQRIGLIEVMPETEDAVNHHHKAKCNAAEARMVAKIVEIIASLCQQNDLPKDWGHRLGIIVPFRNQIALIRNEMNNLSIEGFEEINIDTVERYQGSQRDIIIFSTTVVTRYELSILSAPVQMDDCLIDRKLNVAITRARKQFFMVGNPALLKESDAYRTLLTDIPCWNALCGKTLNICY